MSFEVTASLKRPCSPHPLPEQPANKKHKADYIPKWTLLPATAMHDSNNYSITDNFHHRPISWSPLSNHLAITAGNHFYLQSNGSHHHRNMYDLCPMSTASLVKFSPNAERLYYVENVKFVNWEDTESQLAYMDQEKEWNPLGTASIDHPINDIEFCDNPNELLLASDRVSLQDMRSPGQAWEIGNDLMDTENPEIICTIRKQPNGYFVALGKTIRKTAEIWDPRKLQKSLSTMEFDGPVKGLEWNEDGNTLAALGGSAIKVCDVKANEEVTYLSKSHSGGSELKWLDKDTFLTAHAPNKDPKERTIKIWDLHKDGLTGFYESFTQQVTSIDIHPVTKTICVATPSKKTPSLNYFVPTLTKSLTTYLKCIKKHGVMGAMR